MNLIPEKSGLKWQNIRLKNPSRKMSKMGEPHQEFTIMKFCKEVHHEKQRQRRSHSGSWQWFCNEEAREMHESHVNELRRLWAHDNDAIKLREDTESIWVPYKGGDIDKR